MNEPAPEQQTYAFVQLVPAAMQRELAEAMLVVDGRAAARHRGLILDGPPDIIEWTPGKVSIGGTFYPDGFPGGPWLGTPMASVTLAWHYQPDQQEELRAQMIADAEARAARDWQAFVAQRTLANEEAAREAAEQRLLKLARHARLREILAAIEPGPLRAVADLHEPGGSDDWPVCEGCDIDGYEAEPPDWPCRTATLIGDHLDPGWRTLDATTDTPDPTDLTKR